MGVGFWVSVFDLGYSLCDKIEKQVGNFSLDKEIFDLLWFCFIPFFIYFFENLKFFS
jgi:hypothetical protein